MIRWPWVSRKEYDTMVGGLQERIRSYRDEVYDCDMHIQKLRDDLQDKEKELSACWKKINADTQLKRKKEEAGKPREKNGRFARKVKG
jgi:DNA repair ATPase RecN